jgi:asparagine synthase (glutamine-hydrolysing)
MESWHMCGVFGSFGLKDDGRVERGLTLLRHRGPDGEGIAAFGEAVHGHVRLSLVDLSDASAQPFRVGGGLLSWVGEIWNHAEARAELEAEGTEFRTIGDTEVLARSLAMSGMPAGLAACDGMFAGAWSSAVGDWLFRDRFGKIPLYVLRRGRSFEWASERKAWGRRGGLAEALPPGSFLDLRTGRLERWYSVPEAVKGEEPPAIDLIDVLRRGVAKRLAADAPVCVLASGGLDSSLILALAAEAFDDVTAFTAKLDPDAADLREARRLCQELGVRLIEVECPEPTPELLAEACWGIEIASKAQAEIAFLCLPLACRVRAEGFKACLSGEAADELFGGYGNSCIRAASLDDVGWINHRRFLLAKMARGNFVRTNKAFMAAGVECRLPFMERELVESVLRLGKAHCPPGKGMLKAAARGIVPGRIVGRVKETFQGGSGLSAAAARAIHDPLHFYHAEVRRAFGRCVSE